MKGLQARKMRLLLTFDYYADIIDVPTYIVEDIERYKNDFYDWLYDKTNHHSYWVSKDLKHDGSQDMVMYGSEAILEWLNTCVLEAGEKAILVEAGLDSWDDIDLPSIWF